MSLLKTNSIVHPSSTANNITLHSNGAVQVASLNITTAAAGTVLQVQTNYYTSNTQLTSSGALHELTTNLRTSITPKSNNSILIFQVYGAFVSPNSNNLEYAAIYDVTNAAYVNLPPANGSRTRVHWAKRTSAVDVNDFDTMNFTVSATNSNTTARTYTLYHGTEASTIQFLSSTLSSSAGVTMPLYMQITEVAQ